MSIPGALPARYLRALGSRERCLARYSERNPLLFVLVAEFGVALDALQLGAALHEVQARHPLLSAHIEDHPDTGLGFYRADSVAPIDLTFHRDVDQNWHVLAAEELSRPFDSTAASLMRATLMTHGMTSTLLLTFDHVISDGISAMLVLDDLLAVLNGEPLTPLPLPESLESLAARRFDLPHIDDMVGDARMAVPASVRRFDAKPPYLHRVAMSRSATADLVARCPTERTTVHAAIVTAASRVRAAECGEDFVRTYSPINARGLVAQGDGCCLCISFACTGMAPEDGAAFWSQAREVTRQLEIPRSPAGLMLGSVVIDQYFPNGADCAAAEHFLCTLLPYELTITNLGTQDFAPSRRVRPHAVWGPVVLTQIDRECVTGVITYGGQLRMLTAGHAPTACFLENVHRILTHAPRYPF